MAEGSGPPSQREGRGHRLVRPDDPRGLADPRASRGLEAPAPRPRGPSAAPGPVLSSEHLSSRSLSMPVLRESILGRGADVRPRHPGLPGRAQGLGEHRHLLHPVQPEERGKDPAGGRTEARPEAGTPLVSRGACHHLRHSGSPLELAGLPLEALAAKALRAPSGLGRRAPNP